MKDLGIREDSSKAFWKACKLLWWEPGEWLEGPGVLLRRVREDPPSTAVVVIFLEVKIK